MWGPENMPSFKRAFSVLQKIGKCMMLPVSVLPVAGILLGVGSANLWWLPATVSQVMAASGSAIFGTLPLLFAIGVAIGLTGNDGVSALAATVATSSCSPRWEPSPSSLAWRLRR